MRKLRHFIFKKVVFLPFNATIFVNIYSNAAFTQRVTLVFPNGRTRVFRGSGEGKIIGSTVIRTPSRKNRSKAFPIKVIIEHSASGNRFVRSKVIKDRAKISIVPFKIIGLFSEDSVDNDFNDAIVTFSFFKKFRKAQSN